MGVVPVRVWQCSADGGGAYNGLRVFIREKDVCKRDLIESQQIPPHPTFANDVSI